MRKSLSLLLCGLGFGTMLNAQSFEYNDIKIVPSVNNQTDYSITTNDAGDVIMVWRDVAENKLAYKRFSREHDYTKAAPAKLTLRNEPHEVLKLSNGFNMVAGTDYLVVTDPKFKCCSEAGTNKRGKSLNEFRTTKDKPSSMTGVAEFDATAELTDVHFLEVAESPNGDYAFSVFLSYYWDEGVLMPELNIASYNVSTDKINLHRMSFKWEQKALALTASDAKQNLEMEVVDNQYLVVAYNDYGGNKAHLVDYKSMMNGGIGYETTTSLGGEGWYLCDFFVENEIIHYVVTDDIFAEESIKIGKMKQSNNSLSNISSNELATKNDLMYSIYSPKEIVNLDNGKFVMLGKVHSDNNSSRSSWNMPYFVTINSSSLTVENFEFISNNESNGTDSHFGSNILDVAKIGNGELAVLMKAGGNFVLTRVYLGY